MIARDKNSLGDTILYLPAFRELRRSSKELLGPTVTTDHGTMQRLLPMTWTDTSCSAIFGWLGQPRGTDMIAPPLQSHPLLHRVWSMGDFEI